MTQFTDLGLGAPLCAAVAAEGYQTPTPIQAGAIPHLLAGRDLLGIAQTGTGKTAAFALPILERLGRPDESGQRPHPARKSTRALILTPTRELAAQIGASFGVYGRGTGLRHFVVTGGVAFGAQINALARGIDILVATPGRLLDLAQAGHVRLDAVSIFVLDEADRMLDMGFIRDVKRIVGLVPVQRQTLLFSATMPDSVAGLAASILNKPERVEATPPATTVERIDQKIMFVSRDDKRRLLERLLAQEDAARVIVFTRTKHGANRVAEQLAKRGHKADAIHGNKSQNARQRALSDFRDGALRALVATDIAARGIDVDGITHVVNFDMPVEPESYVHRIGRTARAGADGIAHSYCSPDELDQLRAIEKTIGRKVSIDADHPFHLEHLAAGYANGQRGGAKPQAAYSQRPRPANQGHRPKSGGRPMHRAKKAG
ncbi:MAG: DEAD/DEAH box helicase [Rhodospirillales bacterium]|nr:DEAD/DEAH box helicase [Rhodospirillales bacterium]